MSGPVWNLVVNTEPLPPILDAYNSQIKTWFTKLLN